MTDKVGEWEDAPKNVGEWENVSQAPASAPADKAGNDGLFSKYKQNKEEGSNVGYAATRGLVKGILGGPGELEHLLVHTTPEFLGLSKPSERGTFLGRQTLFPTTEEVSKGLTAIGIPEPDKKYSGYETAGEWAPAVAAGGKLLYGAGKYAGEKAGPIINFFKGAKAKNLEEALKTEMGGNIAEKVSQSEKGLAQTGKESEAVSSAQTQVGGRGKVASARQEAREKEVESSLDSLSKNKNVLAEDVGGAIQPEGRANLEKLRQARTTESITNIKDPAFESARQRYTSGDSMATNPNSAGKFNETLSEIQTQIERTPEPYRSELQKRLGALRGQEVELSAGEKRAEAVRSAITGQPPRTTKHLPMTLDDAEFMRRILKDKNLGEVIGAKGMDVSRMNTLGDKLLDAMKAYEPRVGDYMSSYKEGSEPITRALAGRGKALTDVELQAEENALFSSDKKAAADYYLNGTEERAHRLLDLVGGKKDQVVNTIKGYFRTEMEGMNSTQAKKFIAKQEGFLRVFPELRGSMNKIAQSKTAAETLGEKATEKAGEASTRLAGEAGQLAQKEKALEAARTKYTSLGTQLETAKMGQLRSVANDMYKNGLIDQSKHSEMLQRIQMIEDSYGDTIRARHIAYYALGGLGATVFGKQALKYVGVLGD